jgi:hypothetical protein
VDNEEGIPANHLLINGHATELQPILQAEIDFPTDRIERVAIRAVLHGMIHNTIDIIGNVVLSLLPDLAGAAGVRRWRYVSGRLRLRVCENRKLLGS